MKLIQVMCWFSLYLNAGPSSVRTIEIPDPVLKAFLVGNYDTDHDFEISVFEASAVTGFLNCSSLGIQSLQGIEYFFNIEVFYCYGNQIEVLPDLAKFTALRTLNCNNNRLQELPDLSENVSLEHLICYQNELTEMPNVLQLPNLLEVSINGNHFDECDAPAIALTQQMGLQTFVFNPQRDGSTLAVLGDPVICIPDPTLKTIMLSLYDLNHDNQVALSEAQQSVGNDELNVNSRGIQDLTGVEYSKMLKKIYAGANEIEWLPDLSRLEYLEILNLKLNLLSHLPSLRSLPRLLSLNVEGNQLLDLPALPPSLLTLIVYFNQLTTFSTDLDLPNLIFFQCDGNRLTLLPDLSRMPNLEYFSCGYNELEQIPDLGGLTKLGALYADHNRLERLPNLENLPLLVSVSAQSNPLVVPPEMHHLPELTLVDLSGCGLRSLPDFTEFPKLIRLHLGWNQLEVVPFLGGLEHLTTVDLQHNALSEFPVPWEHLPLLNAVGLRDNRLSGLLDFSGLDALEILDLRQNLLDEAPLLSRQLTHVYLEFNRLDEGDCPEIQEIASFPNLILFTYSPQGGFSLAFGDLVLWPANGLLQEWVQAITQGSYNSTLHCGP